MRRATYVHPLTAFGKRCMDIIIALTGLMITLPLYPLIVLAIRLDSPGPVISQQLCTGNKKDNYINLFMIKKFRTLSSSIENEASPVRTDRHNPGLTRVGRYLCRLHLDKLPQLWNVLMGDMSIIGPHPERPGVSSTLEDNIPFYTERTYDVTPGITGLAQINLGYDETVEEVRNKVAYDHAYALTLSHPWKWLKMDISVMLRAFILLAPGRSQ